MFTAKDRVLFEKMENLENQVGSFKQRLEEIELSTEAAKKLVMEIDKKN